MGTVRRGMPTRPGPTTRQGDGRAYRTHRGRTTERATRSHIVTWEMMGPVYTIDNILPHRYTGSYLWLAIPAYLPQFVRFRYLSELLVPARWALSKSRRSRLRRA
jgi:hypothetical protein